MVAVAEWNLSVVIDPANTGIISPSAPDNIYITDQPSLTLLAIPVSGYRFSYWQTLGRGTLFGNPMTFNSLDIRATAFFIEDITPPPPQVDLGMAVAEATFGIVALAISYLTT